MADSPQQKSITIKDAIIQLEAIRSSTIISFITDGNALIGPEDAPVIAGTIEMVAGHGGKLPRLDLFLHSHGGFLDPAYKIVKVCREYAQEFNVIVPYLAKSAATVICLGANEIVMTSLSELGPIDPIVQHPYKPDIRVPARSIKDFFQFLNSTETESQITVDQNMKNQMAALLDPYLIGSYQTAMQSAKQIAEMLLQETSLKDNPTKLKDTVKKLTEYYYSHSFVIDKQAALAMGLNIKSAEDTPPLKDSIWQLFLIYQNFMRANNVVKLVGNREINRHAQAAQQQPGINKPQQTNLASYE